MTLDRNSSLSKSLSEHSSILCRRILVGLDLWRKMEDSTLNPNWKVADIPNRQYEWQSTWTKEDKSSIPTQEVTPFPAMPEISVTIEGVLKLLLNSTTTKQQGQTYFLLESWRIWLKRLQRYWAQSSKRVLMLELYQWTGGPQMSQPSSKMGSRVLTGLKSTWIYRTVLKSPWKLNLPWKELEKLSKSLKKSLNFTIFRSIRHCLWRPNSV